MEGEALALVNIERQTHALRAPAPGSVVKGPPATPDQGEDDFEGRDDGVRVTCPAWDEAVAVLPDQVLTLSNHERQVHIVRGHRAAERDGPQNHPHRDRGVSTPASGGGLEIILTEIGGADPLVGRARKINPHRDRGVPTPSSGGARNHLTEIGGCRPPVGRARDRGVPRGGASKSSSRDPGFRRTLGGPMPAADVDLTLMIPVGQNDHRFVPGGACRADAVVRGLEIILTRSGGAGGGGCGGRGLSRRLTDCAIGGRNDEMNLGK